MILAINDLHVTPMIPTKYQIYWPFGSGAEVKNRCSRTILAIFDLPVALMLLTQFGELTVRFREKSEQEGHDGPVTLTRVS